MKKIVLIGIVLMVAFAGVASASTFGVGGAFSIAPLGGLPSSAMLSLKVPQVPVTWGIGAQLGADRFNLAVTADWWLYRQNLVSFLNLYVGPGLYVTLPEPFEIGGRVPIGINAFPIPVLELFLEIAPTLAIYSNRSITIPSFGLQGAFGFRFWFNL